jgi:hypothetical protein
VSIPHLLYQQSHAVHSLFCTQENIGGIEEKLEYEEFIFPDFLNNLFDQVSPDKAELSETHVGSDFIFADVAVHLVF